MIGTGGFKKDSSQNAMSKGGAYDANSKSRRQGAIQKFKPMIGK